jgi:SsrA-binding protein
VARGALTFGVDLAPCRVYTVSSFLKSRGGIMSEKIRQVAENRKARHDYFIMERFEAGIELFGTEVKSLRAGKVNLRDSFCTVKDGQLYANGMHVSPYEQGNLFNRDPLRPKRLLMHKREISRLYGRIKQDGFALIPLSLYFKGPYAKLEIGLCKGKKQYDKREAEAARDAKREIDARIKERMR